MVWEHMMNDMSEQATAPGVDDTEGEVETVIAAFDDDASRDPRAAYRR